MSKIIRLTEEDLVNLVKRVLKEQSDPMTQGVQKVVEECFMQNIEFKDMSKLPTCMAMSSEILKTKKLPTNMEKGMKCVNEITSVVSEDPFSAYGKLVDIGKCLLEKASKVSPVMY